MAPSESTHPDLPIRTVAVIGAGTMGHGIAQVAASSGHATRLFDVEQDAVDRGLARVKANLDKGVDRGKVTPQMREATLGHLAGHTELEAAVQGADIVIEAVPERLELKQELFGRVAAHVASTTVLATNTSSLSVEAIASALPHPDRVIGTHFFNPVHIMKLLELIVAPQTSEATLARTKAWGTTLGKETITIKDFPGFATSRLGLVIGLEAIRMVEQGVGSAEDIDKAMTLGYGFPMGPLRLTDLVGLDVRLHIAEYLSTALPMGAHFEPPALLRRMVDEGKLGKKSGQGFYTW
ncbi:MAG: 3-hydroxyacyl-CoA dehydrogenase family protein [Nannocystaceae bacterium]